MQKKLISIVTACFNEEENVDDLCLAIREIMTQYEAQYAYEHIFIDNASTDATVPKIKAFIEKDKRVRLIVNVRNFGQVRSPFYGLLQTKGAAVISMASDFQDPPDLIREFIRKWEEGYKSVIGIKVGSQESQIMAFIRRIFYFLMESISDTDQIRNFSGYGLYDKEFIDMLRNLDDPFPYLRGLIPEFGLQRAEIEYVQPDRKKGKTKNNFFTLYEMAMLGFVNHSKVPLRLASFIGFVVAMASFLVALGYLIYKLLYWYSFQVGIAPLVAGTFFFGGIQLFFLGIIGEYIGAIFTHVKKRPLVIEKERINFDDQQPPGR